MRAIAKWLGCFLSPTGHKEEDILEPIDLRQKRLLSRSERLVITAVDHTMFYGYEEGLGNFRKTLQKIMCSDGILLSAQNFKKNMDLFISKDSPFVILRLNWSSSFYFPLDYRKEYTRIVLSPQEALNLGADAVACSLFIESGDQLTDAENVELFSRVAREKEKVGIPLIGECYIIEHREMTQEQLHNKVKRVTRVAVELGADMIKTFYTGPRFSEVVENCGAPVFVLGGEKMEREEDAIELARRAFGAGAKGIVFGRNIFMSKDPVRMIEKLKEAQPA